MRGYSILAVSVLVVALAAPPFTGSWAQEEPLEPAAARITYLTTSSVYIDAGREEGIKEGDEIEVVREGQRVAALKVTFLSAHRAACLIVSASVPLAVGDLVRYSPHPPAPPPESETESPAATGTAPRTGETPRGGHGGPHGRVGVRYLVVKDRTGNDNGFTQPALDLKLDWIGIGGSPMDLDLDVRARRTYTTLQDGSTDSESQSRVYRAALSYHQPGSIQRITLGRQFTPQLAALSIFDGLLYEADGKRAGGGVFAGFQPDAADFGYSGDISQYGTYLRVHNRPDGRRRWGVTTGLIGSYTEGTVNREFFYLQGQYYGSRLSAYVTQEIDFNRDWKTEEAEEDSVSPTSTFASLRLKAAEWLTVYGGYDNRRRVRLYRDRVTPLTEFDDSMRRGYWSGAALRFGKHVQAGLDARFSDSDSAGDAQSYGANLGLDSFTRCNLGIRGRSTRFTNDRSEGWIHSLSTGADFASRYHVELSAGRLEETNLVDPMLDRSIDWWGLDLDVLLGRRWYLVLSAERNQGTLESNDQGYASVTYRF